MQPCSSIQQQADAEKRAPNPFLGRPPANVAYATPWGRMLSGKSDELLAQDLLARFEGKVNLIFTSPPFPLNRKKRYGNETGDAYIKWLSAFGALFKKMLTPDGSIVIEMGNSWEPGEPVMSTLALRSLLEFQSKNALHLCQEFVWQNPAKLPSPAQWVNIERIRVKDSFTKLWWMSPTIDRALAQTRSHIDGQRKRRKGVGAAIRRSIPVRTFADWRDPPPWFFEIDMVEHYCGPKTDGDYVHTLVLTDIAREQEQPRRQAHGIASPVSRGHAGGRADPRGCPASSKRGPPCGRPGKPHDGVVMGPSGLDRALLALEAPRCGQGVCRGVRSMGDYIHMELRHGARRALDGADRAGLVEEVGEIGDVHRAWARCLPQDLSVGQTTNNKG